MMLERSLSPFSNTSVADGPKMGYSPALTAGFLPAFRHQRSGEIRLCQFADGRAASIHVLDSLPSHWVLERDREGRPSALVAAVDAGYLRVNEFWSLRDLTNPRLDG